LPWGKKAEGVGARFARSDIFALRQNVKVSASGRILSDGISARRKGGEMSRKIDKLPPVYSGSLKEDTQAIINYLVYLHEQINFILAKLDKQVDSTKEEK